MINLAAQNTPIKVLFSQLKEKSFQTTLIILLTLKHIYYLLMEGQRLLNKLTDKDYQLVSKVFRRIAQLFYENSENEDYVGSIVCITYMIPEIVASKFGLNSLTVASQMQILKAKTKGNSLLKQKLTLAIEHLKSPRYVPLDKKHLVEAFSREELFTYACTISLRFIQVLKQDFEVDWKQIIDLISQNIDKAPYLSVQLLTQICKENEQNAKLVSKSGIIKYIFLEYFPKNLKDKFNLYKGIKLVKAISIDKTLVREREKTLAIIIYTYENYIPVISEISSKCYDSQYCNAALTKNVFQASGIDYAYVWSYVQQFAKNQLSQQIVSKFLKLVTQRTSPDVQAKVFAILSNYCKFCKTFSKELLKVTPKYQQSLVNYLKMCYNMSEVEITSPHFISWSQLNDLLLANSNPKTQQIGNYLKELMTSKGRVGSLNQKFVRMFAADKNADMLLDAASKIPKNNQQLENSKIIFKQKIGTNELDSDTLNMAKQKALQSLRKAIAHKHKLDLNSILICAQFGDIYQAEQFLRTLEMYLTIFQDQIKSINKNKVFELIQWVQDHYTGEIIDWGSISQLLLIICDEDQWKAHVSNLKNYCFWILSIDELFQKDQAIIWNAVKAFDEATLRKKLPLVVGFLGKVYTNAEKAVCLQKNSPFLRNLLQNIVKSYDYNVNLMMLSYFLRGWGEDQEQYEAQKHKTAFQELIAPAINIVISHPRQSPQQNYFLQSCLPYKINSSKVTTQLQTLVRCNGKLAADVYTKQKNNKKGTQIKISNLENQPVNEIFNVMTFAQAFPNAIQPDSVIKLLNHIEAQPCIYWQLFPRYMDIMTAIVDIVSMSESQPLKKEATNLMSSVIKQINTNEDITDGERHQLLEATRDSFQNLAEKGAYIQIQRIKKIVTKIVDQELRDEILVILKNYKIKEEPKLQEIIQIEQPSFITIPSVAKKWLQQDQTSHLKVIFEERQAEEKQKSPTKLNLNSKSSKQIKEGPLQNILQPIKHSDNLSLIEAFQVLKKIINEVYGFQKFAQVYDIFLINALSTYEKEVLGILLSKLYDKKNCPKVLGLLLDKQKTLLSQNQIFELVSKHIPAFAINRREKLLSHEYLDIAIQRVKQGFMGEGCQVIGYNLNQTTDLEYFYFKKHHDRIAQLVDQAKVEDQIAQLLLLIGRAAKFPQIKTQWTSIKLHSKILKFIQLFPKSIKIIANLSFAEASLTAQEIKACCDLMNQAKLMYLYLQSVKLGPSNPNIAHYASQFINNLSLSKSFATCPSFDIKKVINTLKLLFQANFESQNIAPYKYILKAIGFLSLSYSSQFLDQSFCKNIVLFSQKLDIIASYDSKKTKITQLLIELIINLSKNKEKRIILHNCKITLLTATLLQTIQSSHTQLIALCIDAINALCQQSGIQTWYVHQKRLPYILLDILKLQSEETLVLKAMRITHNITLNVGCIPVILRSNILGVIANIVIPHIGLHRLEIQNEEFCKKIQTFILKMITKIQQVKPPLEQILKSGFLDCLVRIIQMTQFQECFLDILFFYSPHIPNFLNRRTFSSLIKILTVKVNDKKTLVKCLQSLRNILSFSYEAEQQDNVIQGIQQMYLKFIATEFTEDALFLLFYHLMRSQKFRELLRNSQDKIRINLQKLGQEQRYKQICKTIVFLIYSPPVKIWIDNPPFLKTQGLQYELMRAGIRCWLYRTDGSYKEAKIDIDEEYNLRVYKNPNGEIKKKYTANIRHIREFQIDFENCKELWSKSIFEESKGLFHSSKPENCCTLISNEAWGSINVINIQFLSFEDKITFFSCFTYLLTIFRL